MWQSRRQSLVVVAILLLGSGITAGGFWWLCTRDNGIAFLPTRPGADWIVYPKPPDATVHHVVPISAIFRYTFVLNAPPDNAALTVCAFKSATVVINGQKPGNLELAGENWKSPSTTDVAGLLRAGTNNITACVTNALGPPALWLRLQTGQRSQGTDERWQVSLADAAWQKARRASQPPAILPANPLYGCGRTTDSVKRVWPIIAMFCALSLFLVWGMNNWLRQRNRRAADSTADPSAKLIYGLFIIVVIARTALFINNVTQLHRSMGFDAMDHEKYVQFIQEKHALPLPKDGWEMHQPPLYYVASAMVLDAGNLSLPDDDATLLLRTVNGIIGLVHCWLALLCLRLLFPENPTAQTVGLLVAAFLPMHLYISQYATNEPLAALFVTAACYLCLRALRAEKESLLLYFGIGVALGAAMLTKLSSLLAIPIFPAVLGLRLLSRRDHALRDWLLNAGTILLSCLAICGWYYGRVWMHLGKLPLPNWETDPASAWWQDPAFRTSTYYFNFGQALICPLLSAYHSFADGIYSTLWGDGLISGASLLAVRPPWNYDLMNAEYLLALGISVLFLVGFAVALVRFIRQPAPEWLLVGGLISLFGLGIVCLTLRGPWLAHVKAFYALPALVPFSALVAVGWGWLGQKHRAMRTVLWVVLLVWAMTAYAAFWIRNSNPETHRARGICQAAQHNYPEAIGSLTQTLRLNPDDADAHCYLAEILSDQNQAAEAVQHYREALRIRPDFPEALNHLALILAIRKETDIKNATHAIQLAEHACKLTFYGTPIYISTLAVAYAEAGRFDEAISTADKACEVASESGDKDSLKDNQAFLANNLNNLAWTLATSKETNIWNGPCAVQLAEYACKLTSYRTPDYISTLAVVYAEAGQFDDAISTADKACEMASESGNKDSLKDNQAYLAINLNNLAWTLATSRETNIRNGPRAVQLAEYACKLMHYRVTLLVGTLAAAYAEAGRFEDAVSMAQKACGLASESGNQDLLKKNQELLALYLKHQPYREATEKLVPAAP
ncbi:MAG: tetratricopeptide repeat protein [Verrucomicrobiota bacterium]